MDLQVNRIETIDVANILGEGVLWRASDATIWWTDIEACKLFCLSWPELELRSFDTPERVGSFSFIEGSDEILLVAFESGFAVFDPVDGGVRWLDRPDVLDDGRRLNDGRTDPDGRFWAGSMVERPLAHGEVPSGVLFKLDRHASAVPMKSGIHISNGLCWSPDGCTMYFADSPTHTVFRTKYDRRTGTPGRFEPMIAFDGVHPDGAITDRDGNYWSALWGGSAIACVSPNGHLVGQVHTETIQPTCVAFGGPNLNLMIVSTAKQGLAKQGARTARGDGNLLIYETNLAGWTQPRANVALETLALR